MKTKYYKLYGKVQYIFDGFNELYVKVVKEDKKTITGYKIWNWKGNYFEGKAELYEKLIIINKDSLTAFQEVVPITPEKKE